MALLAWLAELEDDDLKERVDICPCLLPHIIACLEHI